jgi:hypothetical protein
MKLLHLTRRFVGSLRPTGPSAEDQAWARSFLLPGESALWSRLSNADQRHSVTVARDVVRRLGDDATRPVLAAALMHDVGKVTSGLGTFARVGATVVGTVVGRERPGGRIGSYLRHDELGAHLLEVAGSDTLTVTWAAEHHLPPDRWSLDARVAAALKAADDD